MRILRLNIYQPRDTSGEILAAESHFLLGYRNVQAVGYMVPAADYLVPDVAYWIPAVAMLWF